MISPREICASDIMPMDEYALARKGCRDNIIALKHSRRVAVGPYAVFNYECYQTMWHQIHEMLFIEKGGAEQVDDELNAFNPLIPKGRELVATVMFEIDDSLRRHSVLARLGGIEETAFTMFDSYRISGVADLDVARTNESGKASSVQFLHFPFTAAQVEAFRTTGMEVVVGFGHKEYSHTVVISEEIRAVLAEDFD